MNKIKEVIDTYLRGLFSMLIWFTIFFVFGSILGVIVEASKWLTGEGLFNLEIIRNAGLVCSAIGIFFASCYSLGEGT